MPLPRWEQKQPQNQNALESSSKTRASVQLHIGQTPRLQRGAGPAPAPATPKPPRGQRCPQNPGATGAAAEAAGRYSINHRRLGSDDSGFYLPVFGISVRNDLQMLFTAFGLGVN